MNEPIDVKSVMITLEINITYNLVVVVAADLEVVITLEINITYNKPVKR